MFWQNKHGLQAKRVASGCFREVGGRDKDIIFAYLTPEQDGKENPKSLSNLGSLRGSARDEAMKLRLQQGALIAEISSAFETTPEFIDREQMQLFQCALIVGKRQLVKSWRLRKKGRWSDEVRYKNLATSDSMV